MLDVRPYCGGGRDATLELLSRAGELAPDCPDYSYPVTFHARHGAAEATTVGDLLSRVSQATYVPVWADRRLALRQVWIWGQRARAGDVLLALCVALPGASYSVNETPLLSTPGGAAPGGWRFAP
jgi:hypothetical protein